jgi:hypothetical protein
LTSATGNSINRQDVAGQFSHPLDADQPGVTERRSRNQIIAALTYPERLPLGQIAEGIRRRGGAVAGILRGTATRPFRDRLGRLRRSAQSGLLAVRLRGKGRSGRQTVLHVDDPIGRRAGVEETDRQGLVVGRITMQIEIILEIAAHAPQPIGGAVVEVALGDRDFAVGAAANDIRKINFRRIGGAGPGNSAVSQPQIKIRSEARLGDVDARNVVEINARIDNLLATAVNTRTEIY